MIDYRQPEIITQAGFRLWIEGLVGQGQVEAANDLLIDKCRRYPNQAVGAFAIVASSSDPEVRLLVASHMDFLLDREDTPELSRKAAFRIMGQLCRDEVPYVASSARALL